MFELSSDFDPSLQTHEFLILTDAGPAASPGFCGHHVCLGNRLGHWQLTDARGQVRGYMIGWVFGAGVPAGGGTCDGPRDDQSYADWAWHLSGKFICYLAAPDGGPGSFHLDATGSLGLVYDPADRSLAAAPQLLPSVAGRIDARFEARCRDRFASHGHFGFGETAVEGVFRLMPDFALDARTFEARRLWPLAPCTAGEASGDRARLDAVFDAVSQTVGQVLSRGHGALHLTAGVDSRMVLAAAWRWRTELPLFTIAPTGGGRSVDTEIAGAIVRRHGLRHLIIASSPLTDSEEQAALRHTGYCVSDPSQAVARISGFLERDLHFVSGIGGEVGRCFWWDASDIDAPRPTVDALLDRTGVVTGPGTRAAGEAWLAGLPDMPTPLIWDLAYREIRLAHWAGVMTYAFRGNQPAMSAFNSLAAVRAMMALSPGYRASGRFARDFIALGAPELLEFPFNRTSGWRRLLDARGLARALLPARAYRQLKSGLRDLRRATAGLRSRTAP